MIIKNNTDLNIERHKLRLGLVGDVYMIGHYIESLETHKLLIPASTATTIEEAEQERMIYEEERKQLALQQQEEENGEPE